MNARKQLMNNPMLDGLLEKADQMSRRELEEGTFSSAFGIGRRIKSTLLCEYIIERSSRSNNRESEFRHVAEALRKYQSIEYTQWQSSTPPHLRPHAFRASAICQRQQVQPASGEIVILLENMAGYAMCWVRSYRMTESGYKFDELVAEPGDPIVFSPDYSSSTPLHTHRIFQPLNKAIPCSASAAMPSRANNPIPNTTPMIFYEQTDQQIKFILNENICREISSWNRQHLTSQLGQHVLPTFQLTLLKDKSDAICIEVEQFYPESLEGETFKQVFAAQPADSEMLNPTSQFSYLKPPNYELPTVVPLTLSLVRYWHLINGWQDWTTETALSGRYVYAFGEIYGDPCADEDGWIKDIVTGEFLELFDTRLMALSE